MIGERIYRFLIPGCIYVFALLLALIFFPQGVDLKGFTAEGAKTSVALVAVGSGLILVVVGYVCSELSMAFLFVDEAEELKKHISESDRTALKGAVGTIENSAVSRAELTLFVHCRVAKDWPRMTDYLQRGWSRILLANNCFFALVLAIPSYALTVWRFGDADSWWMLLVILVGGAVLCISIPLRRWVVQDELSRRTKLFMQVAKLIR